MKHLPTSKRFAGDSLGPKSAVILTQLKRSETAALYSRARESTPDKIFGYEVFLIKTVRAGSPLPGGGTVEEDYESYPGSTSFGKTAWYISGPNALVRAEKRFAELSVAATEAPKSAPDDATTKRLIEYPEITWPSEPFTVRDIEAQMTLPYNQARQAVLSAVNNNVLQVEGKSSGTGRGKPATLYRRKL